MVQIICGFEWFIFQFIFVGPNIWYGLVSKSLEVILSVAIVIFFLSGCDSLIQFFCRQQSSPNCWSCYQKILVQGWSLYFLDVLVLSNPPLLLDEIFSPILINVDYGNIIDNLRVIFFWEVIFIDGFKYFCIYLIQKNLGGN